MRRCSALRLKHTTSSAARPHTLYPYTLEKTTEAITDTKAIAAFKIDRKRHGYVSFSTITTERKNIATDRKAREK